jgi:hypothetical protein
MHSFYLSVPSLRVGVSFRHKETLSFLSGDERGSKERGFSCRVLPNDLSVTLFHKVAMSFPRLSRHSPAQSESNVAVITITPSIRLEEKALKGHKDQLQNER